jgi:hypothetical protein
MNKKHTKCRRRPDVDAIEHTLVAKIEGIFVRSKHILEAKNTWLNIRATTIRRQCG